MATRAHQRGGVGPTRKLCAAICARDPDQAHATMGIHIDNACLRSFEGKVKAVGQKRNSLSNP